MAKRKDHLFVFFPVCVGGRKLCQTKFAEMIAEEQNSTLFCGIEPAISRLPSIRRRALLLLLNMQQQLQQ